MQLYFKKLYWHDPKQVFLSLYADKKYAYWLDNPQLSMSHVPHAARPFSYMGMASKHIKYTLSGNTLTITDNNQTRRGVPPGTPQILHQHIFAYLQKQLAISHLIEPEPGRRQQSAISNHLPFNFTGGFVGYFGYEIGSLQFNNSPFPDSYFFYIDKFLAFDHKEKKVYLVSLAESEEEANHWLTAIESQLSAINHNPPAYKHLLHATRHSPLATRSLSLSLSRSHNQYLKDIKTCQDYLNAGHAYQICLTSQIRANIKIDPLSLYLVLRETNPAPHAAYINFGDFSLLSSSPEQFLQVGKNGMVTSRPMKGTIRRGKTPLEDKTLARNLGKTIKDFAENIMIVDLVRNDLGKVCNFGSVKVQNPLEVQSYSTVHQLVSTITGQLRPGLTAIDAIQAAFPGGSMTGAPKKRACEIISEIEKEPRGIYSGTFGFISLNGTASLAMIIRTIIAEKNKLSFGTGGAILTDSAPVEEYNEMLLKAKALIEAIMKTTGAKSYKITGVTNP